MKMITKELLSNNNIRRANYNGVVCYSLVDVFDTLYTITVPNVYINNLKSKDFTLQSKIHRLKILCKDNKYRMSYCAPEETIELIMKLVPDKLLKSSPDILSEVE